MKLLFKNLKLALILPLLVTSLCTLVGCNNDDDDNSCQGIDCLPPTTQTGAGTFGCLVNGEPFVDNSGSFNCFYQLVDGEYYFGIRARNDIMQIHQINLGSLNKSIAINENIPLNDYIDGEFYAEISYVNQSEGAFTTNAMDGFIRFEKFDLDNNIVSGNFDFLIIDEFGNNYEITEGRFDSFFTE